MVRVAAIIASGGALVSIGLFARVEPLRVTRFATRLQVPYGAQASALSVGDLNGDAMDDLIVLDQGLVRVLLADPRGGYQSPGPDLPGVSTGRQVAAVDLNRDRNLDIVALNAAGVVVTEFGNGLGAFGDRQTVQIAGGPTAFALGDFDNDKDIDVAVALANGPQGGAVTIVLNDGEGGLSMSGATFAAGPAPIRIAAGDFDGGGQLDATGVNEFAGTCSVLYGDGSGGISGGMTLSPAPDPRTPAPLAVAAGDFDGDGLDDLVVGNGLLDIVLPSGSTFGVPPGIEGIDTVLLFRSRGRYAFDAAQPLPVSNLPQDLIVADVDGDGLPDIISLGLLGIAVFIQSTNTHFTAHTYDGTRGARLALGDANGDGRPDIFYLSGSPKADILVNEGGGQFPRRNALRTSQPPPGDHALYEASEAVAVDLDGDSFLDVVTTTGQAGRLVAFLGLGHGRFSHPVETLAGIQMSRLVAGEFSGDENADVVVIGAVDGRFVPILFTGDGAGGFTRGVSLDNGGSYSALLAIDANEDVLLDIVAVVRRPGDGFVGADVWLSNGNGTFSVESPVQSGRSTVDVLHADLNSDGHDDLLLLNQAKQQSVFLGTGNGRFGDAVTFDLPSAGVLSAALDDLNEDGFPDLVVSLAGDPSTVGSYRLLGDGSGLFRDPILLNLPFNDVSAGSTFAGAIATADYNADGHVDVATAAFGGVSVFSGNGNGTFAIPPAAFAMATGCLGGFCPLLSADLTGDGLADLTMPSQGVDEVFLELLFNVTLAAPLVRGDANCDGTVSEPDRAALTGMIFDSHLPSLECPGSDVNRDGTLSVADLLAVAQCAAGESL